MKIKGVEINEGVIGRKVKVTRAVSFDDSYLDKIVEIHDYSENGDDGDELYLYTQDIDHGWWFEMENGDDFEWVVDTPIETIKSKKTERKAVASKIKAEIEKLNKTISQAYKYGMEIDLQWSEDNHNLIEVVELSYQAAAPKRETY